MLRRALFACIAIAMAGSALAQEAISAPPLPQVALETSAGRVVIEVNDRAAPVTGANFLRYVDEKRLDGTSFYRAMKAAPGAGLVQGGTQNDPARVLEPIAHEPTTQTGLRHVDGAVSMARYAPGTATGDFFVSVGATPAYDAGRPYSIDADGFAVFGRVVEGLDIVRGLLDAPKSLTEGEGFMRGQMLDPKITIVTARRVEAAPTP